MSTKRFLLCFLADRRFDVANPEGSGSSFRSQPLHRTGTEPYARPTRLPVSSPLSTSRLGVSVRAALRVCPGRGEGRGGEARIPGMAGSSTASGRRALGRGRDAIKRRVDVRSGSNIVGSGQIRLVPRGGGTEGAANRVH